MSSDPFVEPEIGPRFFLRPWLLIVTMSVLFAGALCSALLYASSGRVPASVELAPPDTSSPQSTLAGLQREAALALGIIRPAFDRHIHSSGLFASAETNDDAALAHAHLQRAMRYLDLTAITPATRERTGTERVLMLSELLERVAPLAGAEVATNSTDRWNVPGTDIRIVRTASGPRSGEYLFSAETVERIPEFYTAVAHTPDRDNFDFYKFYSLSPGDLIPPKWYGLVLQLPEWALEEYSDQALWQWFGFALVLTVFLAVVLSLFALGRTQWMRAPRHAIWRRLIRPAGCLVAAVLADAGLREINLTGLPYLASKSMLHVICYVSAAWLFGVAMLAFADTFTRSSGIRPKSIDAGMIRLALRIIGVVGGASILAYGASGLGVPLMGIVAGLGVGGLAVALAAQPTLENLIGGVIIYADRPVRVGDQCKFGDISGTVEEIGIRSTRIRAADRTLITIPNADFSKQRLVNSNSRDRLVVNAKVGLRYDTKQVQLREILSETERFFRQHPMIDGGASTVRLVDFGMSSVDLELAAQLATENRDNLPSLRQEILLQFAGIVEQAGSGFAERA